MKNRGKLYFFGVKLGLFSIFKLRKITSRIMEMIIIPLNYWRSIETPLILKDLQPIKEGEIILDIGSPKLLSLFLAKQNNVKVIASDINSYFSTYCKEFASVLKITNKYATKVLDARNMKISSNSIDKVYALSVFEHIPEKGDTLAIKEVSRILKKGGIVSLTMPYSLTFKEEFKDPKQFYYSRDINLKSEKKKAFYQRVYNEKELNNRIIIPSGMKLITKQYFGQLIDGPKTKFSMFLGPFNIILSKLNHNGPFASFSNVRNLAMVHLVLKK